MIFKERADFEMYVDLVKKYKAQYAFKLFSYCLVPGGLHLLIETGQDASISEIMHDLNSMYTKYFNGRYRRKGPLFESRFRSVLVEKANFLLQMTRFVHRIPQDVKGYPYSSFDIYVRREAKHALDLSGEIDEVRSFLEGHDDPAAYERYCLQGGEEEIESLDKTLRRGSILGSEAFSNDVRLRLEEHAKAQREEALARKWARPSKFLIVMVGLGILVATTSSVYLYISKKALQREFVTLLEMKEQEFALRTRFENISPIALAELDGTRWEIVMIPRTVEQGRRTIQDKVAFSRGQFSSEHFRGRGYGTAQFRLAPSGPGGSVWRAVQSNARGDTVSWRGDWIGDVMKGEVRIQPAGKKQREFSFFSTQWSYLREPAAIEEGGSR